MENLKVLIKDIHQTAKEHGWWKKEKKFSTIISLIHSELSEALEFERGKGNLKEAGIDHLYHYTGTGTIDVNGDVGAIIEDYRTAGIIVKPTEFMSNVPTSICKKPDGVLPELADVVIRVFDYIGHLGMEDEFVDVILEKHKFNKTRPHLHGGKKF